MKVRTNSYRARTYLAGGALLLAAGMTVTSCIDKDFDLNEDIDMTMGLGSEGLAVKLGSTDKVYLEDILDVDQSVKLDGTNTYYLVEDGTTEVNFHVNPVTTSIDNATLHAEYPVIDFKDVLADAGAPEGSTLPLPGDWKYENRAYGTTKEFTFNVKDIQTDVKQVETIYPEAGTEVLLTLRLVTSPGVKMAFTEITDLTITMPDYLRIKSVTEGTFRDNVITIPRVQHPENGIVCKVAVDRVELGEDGIISGRGELTLPVEKSKVTMDGHFRLAATGAFSATADDYANVELDLTVGNGRPGHPSTISLEAVTGKFDPVIEPNIKNIDITEDLPDFLNDPEVTLQVANPTLKFVADMTEVPMTLNFRGELTAHKTGADGFDKMVRMPETGNAVFTGSKDNCVYFAQTATPYDPAGLTAGATTHVVKNLSTLVEKLPDYISVDVSGGKMHVKDGSYTIRLGHNYHTDFAYNIYVPFQFNSGLKIVYRDSTNSLNDDLKDYQAEGIEVTATAFNTVPLELLASIYPVDIDGNEIPGIHIDEVSIPAGDGQNETKQELKLSIKLDNPKDLQRVDRLLFRIHAEAEQTAQGQALNARQYLLFKDVRLRLKGQVVGDFN